MVSGPTSRAVGHSKEEEEEYDEVSVLYLTLTGRSRYFIDKRPLQKHSKLSKKPLNPSV